MSTEPSSAIDGEPTGPKPVVPTLTPEGVEIGRTEMAQYPLFLTDELVVPESLRSFRKAVAAIHAIPTKKDVGLSLNCRRLQDALIICAQLEMRKRERKLLERVQSELVYILFEVRVTDLARIAGIAGKNYRRLYADLDELYELSLQWNALGEDSQVQWETEARFLTLKARGVGIKNGLVRFAFEPHVLRIVLEPSNWATLSLQVMAGLRTAPAYALYQAAFRYINTVAKVTAILPVSTWIELLMGPCRYVVDDPKVGKVVVDYGDFKRRVLNDAMARVNDIPALGYTLELKEYRAGHRVAKLQFKLVSKKQASLGLPVMWTDDVLKILAGLGYSQAEIEDLSQVYSYDVVADSIVRLKDAEVRLRAAGRSITSRRPYFDGILKNVASGAKPDELDHEQIEQEARAEQARQAAQERQQRQKEDFGRHQASVFANRLFAMEEGVREALLKDFEASPAGEKARVLLERGWSVKNVGALSLLRGWMAGEREALLAQILANPEDQEFESWLAWRLDSLAPPAA